MIDTAFTKRGLADLLLASPLHRACLQVVREQGLPDGWIGAGFLRNLVWDHLHGFQSPTPLADVDVIYFDPADPEGLQENSVETHLSQRLLVRGFQVIWEAKNQARMHRRNDDSPYKDSGHALEHWLETPTAVAVRLAPQGSANLEFLAPFGFKDLFNLTIRPAPHALSRADRLAAYHRRLQSKPWTSTWPNLQLKEQ